MQKECLQEAGFLLLLFRKLQQTSANFSKLQKTSANFSKLQKTSDFRLQTSGKIRRREQALTVVIWVWKTVNWVWFKPRNLEIKLREQGFNGNSYRLLTGDTKDVYKMRSKERQKPIPFTNDYSRRLFPFLHHLVDNYGKKCFTWLGPVPVINITEAEEIREVLSKMNEFQKPRLNPLIELLAPGLLSYEGDKWAKHRKIVNPAFHMEKLKLMLPAFSSCIIETIEKWEKIVSESAGSSEIDVWPYLMSLSADVISRASFGSSYKQGRRIFELLTEQAELTILLIQSVNLPGWKYMPTKNNRRMKEVNAEIQTLLKGLVEKRKTAMEAGEPTKDDLLGLLLESNFKETQSNEHNNNNKKQHLGMSFQEIIDECKLFYLAGQETTSVLLVWTMILLSKHQEWQTRAREEVMEKFGKDQPDFDGLHNLHIMTMILNEVLRLYPPAPSISRRTYNNETKLGNLSIPQGTMLGLSILQVHHNAEIWGNDALEFKPQRFSEGVAKATKGKTVFFPFGWGPRICVGQNFAINEVKMALAMILQRFSFELSPSYAHAPTHIITLQPQYGAHLILHDNRRC